MADFNFIDRWPVAAEPAQTWEVVRSVEEWPSWWPSALGVTPLDRDPTTNSPVSWRWEFRTRLPYVMCFVGRLVQEERFRFVECSITGRVAGTGRWGIEPVPGGSLVRFDWEISPQVTWMKALTPIARPVFNWNHRALMVEGGEALARRLGARLLSPPVSSHRR